MAGGPLAGSDASHSVELRRTALNPTGAAQCQSSQHSAGSDTATACVSSPPPNSNKILTLGHGCGSAQPHFYKDYDFEPPTTTRGALGLLVGGSYIGDAAITDHKKLAPTGFLLSLLLQYPSPGLGTLTFISCRVKSRWVATPPKSKGTHKIQNFFYIFYIDRYLYVW